MEWEKFLKWFVLSKFKRKFHQAAMVIFVGTILGQIPSPWGIIGALLFLLVYLNTYFYNDVIDYEDDVKKKSVYREKALALGYATQREFFILLGNLSIASVFLATLWDPLLGFFSVVAVLLNNLRTHVKGVVKRQVLLILVELFNFEAFWNAFYGGAIPAIFIPLFIAYSSLYALGHGVYKMRKKGTFTRIIQTRELRNLFIITLLAVVFSLPSLFLSAYHFAFLVLGLLVYALPMLRIVTSVNIGKQKGMERVDTGHHTAITLVGLVLLLGAILYILYGSPLNVYIPKLHNGYYEELTNYFDRLQAYILDQMFGGLKGLRERYDVNSPVIQASTG